ncbi:MAG: hypothetical protein GY861_26730 [bacterium]|nr:hypothetical protein [bacterium]
MSQDTASSAGSKADMKRLVAYKASVSDIINGAFVKGDGWEPNYIVSLGKKMSRVNLMGVIVSKNNERNIRSLKLDDSTGVIPIHSFNDDNILEKTEVGDAVTIIGRPRNYGEEKYIMPELVKKLSDLRWIEHRKLELKKTKPEETKVETESVVVEEKEDSDSSRIYELIKEMDSGDGVEIDDVITKAQSSNAEQIINNLLREGDIFEVRAGRIKVLE